MSNTATAMEVVLGRLTSIARSNAIRVMVRRPDFIIGGAQNPYLLRWRLLPRNPLGNIYIHRFCRSDDDRALHDHPWPSASWLVDGAYIEVTQSGAAYVPSGSIIFRRPSTRHRIALTSGDDGREKPCVTIFVIGPRVRQWGFWCPQGFVHWRAFVAGGDPGAVGRGCDQ